MQTSPQTDGDLVRRLKAGNQQACSLLYDRYSPAVYRYALHMSGNPHIAEEVVQDTFLTFVRRPGAYDEVRGPLIAWLLGVARKLAYRAIGMRPGDAPLEEALAVPTPAVQLDDLTRREGIESIRQAVHSLPPAYREAVVLCDLQELDYRDAAEVLNCPVGTVRSRLHRGRMLLLAKLSPRCLV